MKPTLLYVEDDDYLRDATVSILQHEGYEVLQAANGEEGLKVLAHDPSKKFLLISDLQMPKLTGDGMIAEALRLGIDFHGIIIASSASYVGMGIAKLISEGRAKVLPKPFSATDLLEIVGILVKAFPT